MPNADIYTLLTYSSCPLGPAQLCRETDTEEEAQERLARSARAVEDRAQRARRDRERMRVLAVDLRVQRGAELDRWAQQQVR